MTEARALEIIAAMGADPARWPADERAHVAALASRPMIVAALREAAALDALLDDWAQPGVAAMPFDAAALIPAASVAAAPAQQRRWWAAGAVAVAVAAAVVLAPMPGAVPTTQTARSISEDPVMSATGTSEAGDAAAFAYVFTPTVDEDAVI